MADPARVFIHIGAPKTGTTYLQQVMHRNSDRLAEQGILYPDLGLDAHHTAAWSLRPDDDAGGVDVTKYRGDWERLVELADAWDGGTVVISTEMFVFFGEDLAAKVLGSFGAAEVHVVYTARDLVRQAPAVWQEQIKNRRSLRYRAFLLDLLGPRATHMARHFWRAQDAPKALNRWSQGLPPERVHVVVAPPTGAPPDTLWQRFASVVGIDSTNIDLAVPAVNTSLSATSAELLRRYNVRHGDAVPLQRYRRTVLRPLMPALTEAVQDRTKLPLSRRQQRRLARHCVRVAEGIEAAGYDVVGSLDELVPGASRPGLARRPADGPDQVSDRDLVNALLDVVHHLLEEQRLSEARGRKGRGPSGRRGRRGVSARSARSGGRRP